MWCFGSALRRNNMRCSWKARGVSWGEMRTGAKQLSRSSVPHNYPQSCLLRRHCCLCYSFLPLFVFFFVLLQFNTVIKQKREWVKPLISKQWRFVCDWKSKALLLGLQQWSQCSDRDLMRVHTIIDGYSLDLFRPLISLDLIDFWQSLETGINCRCT